MFKKKLAQHGILTPLDKNLQNSIAFRAASVNAQIVREVKGVHEMTKKWL